MSSPRIAGWPAISDFLSELVGIPITVHAARKFEARQSDPLPVQRWGPIKHPRITATRASLTAWATRQRRHPPV